MQITRETNTDNNSGTGSTSGNKNSLGSGSELEKRFMTMLIAQMQNQDPLNPMDNAQFTSQMSQMQMVMGIEQLNEGLNNSFNLAMDNRFLQAAGMIGKEVLAPGEELSLPATGDIKFGVELAEPTDKVTVKIRDAQGNVVRTYTLEDETAGTKDLVWDGKNDQGTALPDGEYKIEVSAEKGSTSVDARAMTYAEIKSVAIKDNEIKLILAGDRIVSLNDIRQVG